MTGVNITEPSFDESELAMLKECLGSKWVTQGPMTTRFEALLAQAHRVEQVMACTSATAALHLSTLALQLRPGDEVLVPAFTWITSANAAEYVGAKAVFVDIDPATYNIDPSKIEAAITPRTRAIVAVHLFGLAAPMDEILAVAARHHLAVIEDAACAIGTTYRGKPVGGLGHLGCFSFHPRKVVTTGEGGAVTTNDAELAARVRSLRNHGATGAPDANLEPHGPWTMGKFDNLGYNLRLSDIQAAVGVAQMGKMESLVRDRRRVARGYLDALKNTQDLVLPLGGDIEGHTFQSFVVRVLDGGRKRRNSIMSALAEKSIQTRPGTHAVHRLGYYRDKYRLDSSAFPVAAQAEDTTITLPIVPFMKAEAQSMVVETLLAAL